MLHQPHTSLASYKVLLSLPQPSLASMLFSDPSSVTGSTTDSPDVPSNCQNLIPYQAVETSRGTSDVPTTFRNPWRDGSVRQTNQTKIKNPVRCEVCKIDFNSKSVFEDHISGKKHKKKMQLHNNPINTILSGTSNVKNVQVQDRSVQGKEPFVDAGEDLKSKKRKLWSGGEAEHDDQADLTSNNDGIGSKKVKVTQCTRCEICMINCNTKDVYVTHLSGKKHLRNLKKLSKLESDGAGAGAGAGVSVAGVAAAIVTENDKQPASNPAAIDSAIGSQEKDTETKKQSKSKGDDACSGADVSIPGMTAAIIAESDKQPATNPAIESQEKPATNKQECVNSCQPENAVILEASEKDTESKKRKHELDGGTSITCTKFCPLSNVNNEIVFNLPDCPAHCEICMINCNSKPAYIRYISGKIHKRNLEKVSNGAGASAVNAVAAIMTEIHMQPARSRAIEPQEKPGTNKQECTDSCQPENAVILEAAEKDSETKKRSESKSDSANARADVGTAHMTAAIVTENDKQPASNPAAIESQEKPGTNKQECNNSCQPENAVILEAAEKDSETKKRSESKSDSANARADVGIAHMTAAIVTENDKQPASNPAAIESQEKPGTNKQECNDSCQPENAVILEASEKDTETEKQKHGLEGGTSITSAKFCTQSNVDNETVFNLPDCPAWCEICMIDCNRKPAYIGHISGKRHKRNLEKVSKSKTNGAGASVADDVAAIMTAIDMQQATDQAIEPQEKLETSPQEGVDALVSGSVVMLDAPAEDAETKKQKHQLEGGTSIVSTKSCTLSNATNERVFNLPDCPAWCEICMINCNSKPVYITHISGKRHKRNLEKVLKSKNDGAGASVAEAVSAIMPGIDAQQATNQAIEPQEKLETSPQEGVDALKSGSAVVLEASEKDMEAEKRKIEPLDGAATTTFRVCKLCNAPCNSEATFNSHFHGKKHAAMVKKLTNSKSSWWFLNEKI